MERASSARRSPPSTALPATWPASPCRVSAVTARQYSPRRIAAASALPRSNQGEPAESGPVQTYIVSSATENTRPAGNRSRCRVESARDGALPAGSPARTQRPLPPHARRPCRRSGCAQMLRLPTRRTSWATPSWSRTSDRSIARRKSLERRRSTQAAYAAQSRPILLERQLVRGPLWVCWSRKRRMIVRTMNNPKSGFE